MSQDAVSFIVVIVSMTLVIASEGIGNRLLVGLYIV